MKNFEADREAAFSSLFGKAGEKVPEVDFADLKAMWSYTQDLNARHPESSSE